MRSFLKLFFIVLFISNLAIAGDETVSEKPDPDKFISNSPTVVIGGSGGGGEKHVTYTMGQQDPIKVFKTVSPAKEDYLLGDKIRILVEIKNNKNNNFHPVLKDIYIWEITGNGLNVFIPSDNIKILENLFDISDYISNCDIEYEDAILSPNNFTIKLFKDKENTYQLANIPDPTDRYDYEILAKTRFIFSINLTNKSVDINSFTQGLKKEFDLPRNGCNYNLLINNRSINLTMNTYAPSSYNGGFSRLVLDNYTNNFSIGQLYIEGREGVNVLSIYKNNTVYVYSIVTILKIHVKKLSPSEKFVYWYDVIPKKSGTFKTDSIIRIYDQDCVPLADIESPLKLEFNEPIPAFDFDLRQRQNKVYKGEPYEITYDVTYKGGSTEPYKAWVTWDNASTSSEYIPQNGGNSGYYELTKLYVFSWLALKSAF